MTGDQRAGLTERASYSCAGYVLPGPSDTPTMLNGEPVCVRCGWHRNTHHEWQAMAFPNGSLGRGWQCRRCGRTAYESYKPEYADVPPTDYPPCSTWSSTTDTD